ncbi:hypothetical protein MRX96_030165 [Rhipicephalus microplus]
MLVSRAGAFLQFWTTLPEAADHQGARGLQQSRIEASTASAHQHCLHRPLPTKVDDLRSAAAVCGVSIAVLDIFLPRKFSTILDVDYDLPYRHVVAQEFTDHSAVAPSPKALSGLLRQSWHQLVSKSNGMNHPSSTECRHVRSSDLGGVIGPIYFTGDSLGLFITSSADVRNAVIDDDFIPSASIFDLPTSSTPPFFRGLVHSRASGMLNRLLPVTQCLACFADPEFLRPEGHRMNHP